MILILYSSQAAIKFPPSQTISCLSKNDNINRTEVSIFMTVLSLSVCVLLCTFLWHQHVCTVNQCDPELLEGVCVCVH